MNLKIKTIILTSFLVTGLLIGNFSMAAGLSVCGETAPSSTDATAYDNYKSYQAEILPLATARDAQIKAVPKPDAPSDTASQAQQDAYKKQAAIYDGKVQAIRDDYAKKDNALKQKYSICQASDIFKQIARIINFLIGFIGTFVIVRIVIYGFQMVLSQGSEESIKSAKSGMTNAIIGLVLVFAAYLLVNIIFQIAGVKNFGINPFGK